jgi:lipopolysaccharide/colanic/teichoic acid biosynthesis glycosyltransferase
MPEGPEGHEASETQETRGGLYEATVKRLLDMAASFLLLVLTSPIQALCAAAVVIDDGRPVLYHQERVGKDGQIFLLHKFRTMTVGTHDLSGGYPTPAMVTRVGRVLRRLSLDEIPQLANILRGQMSFVGPRPALESQVVRYTPQQRGRLVVRPGLTGLAQIRHRTNAPWSRRITTDLEYIRGLCLKMDLSIVLRTIPAVLRDEGQLQWQTAEDIDDLGAEKTSPGPGQ